MTCYLGKIEMFWFRFSCHAVHFLTVIFKDILSTYFKPFAYHLTEVSAQHKSVETKWREMTKEIGTLFIRHLAMTGCGWNEDFIGEGPLTSFIL